MGVLVNKTKIYKMSDEEETSPIIVFFLFIFCLIMFLCHQSELDEHGRDNYDRSNGIAGRDWLGNVVDENGHYSFTGNLLDMNPYHAW